MPLLPTLLLAGGLALAGPHADDLAAMDAALSDLEGMALSEDPEASTRAVEAGVRDLKQLQGQAAAARKTGSANHRVRVLTRLAEGQVAFFGALLDAPCPAGVGEEACTVYQGVLAEKVVQLGGASGSLAARLREDLIVAGSGPDKLRGREVRRARAARAALESMMARAEAAPPAPPARPAAPRVTEFGRVGGALPYAPAPLPARDAADARPHADARYVQVRRTAVLSARQDGGGATLQVQGAPGAGPVPETLLARLVEERGDRVLLELGAGDHRYHCHHAPPWDATIRVLLWADTDALHRVTTAPIERSHGDGSGVRLRPGALVVDEGVWADGLLLPLSLPEDAVGTAYAESAVFGEAPDGEGVLVDDATKLGLLGRPLPRPPVAWGGDGLVWTDTLRPGPDGAELVGFHSACGVVTLRAEQRDPDLQMGGGLSGLFGRTVGPSPIRVRAGTPLEWPDGGLAGVLAGDMVRSDEGFPVSEDGRRCFDLAAGFLDEGEPDRPGRHLELCVAP